MSLIRSVNIHDESGNAFTNLNTVPVTPYNTSGSEIQLATSTNQEILQTLLETIQELTSRIAFLEGIRGTASDLRVTPLSLPTLSSVTTVSTVTTLTNQTNIGGYNAAPAIPAFQNSIAVQSNINNVVA